MKCRLAAAQYYSQERIIQALFAVCLCVCHVSLLTGPINLMLNPKRRVWLAT